VATQANVARLLDTPGFKVIDCKTEGDLLWVELRGHKRRRSVCSGCGQPAPPSAIHDRKLRTVRDLACFGRRTYLRIEIVRVACPVCGVRVERLGFLHSNPRYSRRFAYQVARLCLAMPVSSAAAVAAISWDAARGLLESVSAAALKPLEPPEDLRWIGVDEKSWRRGRRFCTVVSDLDSGRVIWLAPGHSGEALAEFFAWLGERRGFGAGSSGGSGGGGLTIRSSRSTSARSLLFSASN
jgi:transposase